MSTYRITIRRPPEEVDVSADDSKEALALVREFYPGCDVKKIENEDGSEAEVIRGVCTHCGEALTEHEDAVVMDDLDYCLPCARKLG